MTLNFICRPSKKRKNGQSPIELSIIIDNERTIITLDRTVEASKFIASSQKVKGDKDLNEYLDVIRKKCYNIETELIKQDSLTLKDFVDVFKNGHKRKATTLLAIFDKHNTEYAQQLSYGNIGEDAYKKYCYSRGRILEYLKTIGRDDIKLTEITPSFVANYQIFCLSNLQQSTTNKELKILKRILQYAVDDKLLSVNPFNLKIRDIKKPINALSVTEIEKIENVVTNNEKLSKIRDCFIFQCYTGLAFIDLKTLTKDNIQGDVIIKSRQKTKVTSVIPLLPITKKILEKYEYKLPVISNQKYNVMLKALGELCGIKKNLTSHLGRKTFATLLLNKGVRIETVAKTLGHSSTKITQKAYAQLHTNTIVDEITSKLL